jgi:hypothetical protein
VSGCIHPEYDALIVGAAGIGGAVNSTAGIEDDVRIGLRALRRGHEIVQHGFTVGGLRRRGR